MKFLEQFLNEISSENANGIVIDIEKDTNDNTSFRKVIFTGEHMQLVLMSLQPGEDIGEETHEDIDQFFRVDKGSGRVEINGDSVDIQDGSAFVIPAGARHNVIAGKDGLKVYTIYSPPHHPADTHQIKKEGAWSLMSEPSR